MSIFCNWEFKIRFKIMMFTDAITSLGFDQLSLTYGDLSIYNIPYVNMNDMYWPMCAHCITDVRIVYKVVLSSSRVSSTSLPKCETAIFADEKFECILVDKGAWISIYISLKSVEWKISQYSLRWWFVVELTIDHDLNQWWFSSLMHAYIWVSSP